MFSLFEEEMNFTSADKRRQSETKMEVRHNQKYRCTWKEHTFLVLGAILNY